jgi:hypothetical protein
MRVFTIYLILFISLSTGIARSQVPLKETPLVLEELFNRLVDNYDDNDRIKLNDSIRLIIDGYAKSDTVFSHRFSNLRYMGQILSPDSLIKIIAWNLVLANKPGTYFCYIIKKQESGKENKIYRLSATYNQNQVKTDTIYNESDWYGALYYDLKPFTIGDKRFWVLLGIDYGNPSITRKIIEVLSFSADNSIIFGRKCFASGEELKFRDVFEYASNAMMSLGFRSDSTIVFDHLVPFSPAMKNNRQFYGPDYSFDAYNFENGLWRLKINVDLRNKE